MIAALGIAAERTMIHMPSHSYDGPWQPLSEEEAAKKARLKQDVEMLAGEIGDRNVFAYENYLRAADFIETSFREAGHEVRRQAFETRERTCYNLEVEIKGSVRPDEIVVIGAHYDSVTGTPGANDNGTGAAALLELARVYREKEPERTVRFVAFANEEPPFFQTNEMGSLVYARECRANGNDITGMLSLETIGYYSEEEGSQEYPFPFSLFYPERGNFLGFVGNLDSRQLVRKGIRAFRENTPFPSEGAALPPFVPGVGWSDQWAFWQEGYPGFMVTDTAPFRYPHYHAPSDTPDKIDYERLARVVSGLVHVVEALAKE